MKELVSELNEVAITAGIFSASDKKKSATLNSFDIATTASAMGDIYGTYATMPGSQKVGEEGLLFVRAGPKAELKVVKFTEGADSYDLLVKGAALSDGTLMARVSGGEGQAVWVHARFR